MPLSLIHFTDVSEEQAATIFRAILSHPLRIVLTSDSHAFTPSENCLRCEEVTEAVQLRNVRPGEHGTGSLKRILGEVVFNFHFANLFLIKSEFSSIISSRKFIYSSFAFWVLPDTFSHTVPLIKRKEPIGNIGLHCSSYATERLCLQLTPLSVLFFFSF